MIHVITPSSLSDILLHNKFVKCSSCETLNESKKEQQPNKKQNM